MVENGRTCLLMNLEGSIDSAYEPLERFFQEVEQYFST
jgi:hypothetical protein